jgi:hypothetical protein
MMKNKKRILFFSFFFIFFTISFSQNRAADFFNDDENVIWYGFDFTHAKYIGAMSNGAQQSFASTKEFKFLIIPQLNGLVIKEPLKYNLENTFGKNLVRIDTSFVNNSNSKNIDEKNFQTYDNIDYKINPSDFAGYITNYKFPTNEKGFGIIVFVEDVNKIKNKASYYITVFDRQSKEILFVEYVEGRLLGMGLKNYCAGSIKYIFDEIEKTYYKKWRIKYKKN